MLASDKHFSALPEGVQATLSKCGTETQEFVYEKAAALETELLEVIKDAGVEVNEADKDAFIAASKPIYDEFSQSVAGGREIDRAGAGPRQRAPDPRRAQTRACAVAQARHLFPAAAPRPALPERPMIESCRPRARGRLLEWLVILLMVVLTAVVIVAVLFRIAGNSFSWYDEVASVQLAWITYYGAGLAALKRKHIGFDGVLLALPMPGRIYAAWAAEAVIARPSSR